MPATARPLTDEIRLPTQENSGERSMDPGGPPLVDTERTARLRDIVANPYHERAFRGRTLCDLMRICAYGLLENLQWEKAFRAIARLDRMERDDARTARAAQANITARRAPAEPPTPHAAVGKSPASRTPPAPSIKPRTSRRSFMDTLSTWPLPGLGQAGPGLAGFTRPGLPLIPVPSLVPT